MKKSKVNKLVAKARQEGKSEAMQAVREELTKYLYVKQDMYGDRYDATIGTPPEYPIVMVALQSKRYGVLSEDALKYMNVRPEMIRFRAVRMSWSDGGYNTVHWWNWEPCP